MAKAVFFDLDGTLCDTVPDIQASLNFALAAFGHAPVDYVQTVSYVGNGARKLVERAAPQGADIEGILAQFATHYAASDNSKTAPYAGMTELVTRLKAEGAKLAVITNKLQQSTVKVIDKFYRGLFDFIGGDSGMFPVKPDPSLARYAALTLRVAPRDCMFVGDGETDVLTARNAGMIGVSALWGYRTRTQLEAVGANTFADDVASLEKIIRKFL